MSDFEVSVQKLVISQTAPVLVKYLVIDKKKIDHLNLEHFLQEKDPFKIIPIDQEHISIYESFTQAMKLFESLAGGEDIVKLRHLIIQEVQRIISERLEKQGSDLFAKPIKLE